MSAAAEEGDGIGRSPAGTFGVWVFLASEAMLFGAVILAYLVSRLDHGATFAAASEALSLLLGSLNTAVLLTSSFTIVVALLLAEGGRQGAARLAIIATAVLGLVFLGIKAYEYYDEIERGLLPVFGLDYRYAGPDPQHAKLFFDAYLALTSLHALHLITGIGLMLGITALWKRFDRPTDVLKLSALYWHLIDIVWVFLFPLLYMVK